MAYATEPMDALVQRARYLSTKHGMGVKGNAWNPCWRVWVELVQKLHLVWPPERVAFALSLGKDERPGLGPASIVQVTLEIHYCNVSGQDTGFDTFFFEWYCPLLLKFSDEEHDESWHLPLGSTEQQRDAWLRRLLQESTLRRMAVQEPRWKRSYGHIEAGDVTEYSGQQAS